MQNTESVKETQAKIDSGEYQLLEIIGTEFAQDEFETVEPDYIWLQGSTPESNAIWEVIVQSLNQQSL